MASLSGRSCQIALGFGPGWSRIGPGPARSASLDEVNFRSQSSDKRVRGQDVSDAEWALSPELHRTRLKDLHTLERRDGHGTVCRANAAIRDLRTQVVFSEYVSLKLCLKEIRIGYMKGTEACKLQARFRRYADVRKINNVLND